MEARRKPGPETARRTAARQRRTAKAARERSMTCWPTRPKRSRATISGASTRTWSRCSKGWTACSRSSRRRDRSWTSLREVEAKRADAGNAGAAAETEPEEDAPDGNGGAAELADFYRWVEEDRGRRRRWSLAAMAVAAPAAFLLGMLVQHQFQVLPPHDPSGGWNGWIWEMHGRAIVDCAAEAMRTNAEVDCPLVVRRP